MEKYLELAKKLTNKLLNSEEIQFDKETFYMFSISKFILLKEKIIEKNFANNAVTYDYALNKKYIPAIYELYNYVKDNGKYKIENLDKVIIKNQDKDKCELNKAIWVLCNVRNTLAHGNYVIDYENAKVLINHSIALGTNNINFECDIPIKLLNNFSVYDYKFDNNKITKYINYLSRKYCVDSYINSNNKQAYSLRKKQFINLRARNIPFLSMNYKNNQELLNSYNDNELSDWFKKIELTDNSTINRYINKLEVKKLEELLELLVDYKPKNKDEIKLLHNIFIELKKMIKEKNIHEETKTIIDEIYNLLEYQKKYTKADSVIALYNYMALSLSEGKRLANTDFSYLKTPIFYFKDNENYNDIKENINSISKTFCKKIESIDPKDYSSEAAKNISVINFNKFYINVMKKFNTKNYLIVKEMRNSVEHGNYRPFKDKYVGLYDLYKDDDNLKIKFLCADTPEVLFQFTNDINDTNLRDKYTTNDFIKELKKVLDPTLYKKVVKNLNNFSLITFGRDLDLNTSIEKILYTKITNLINEELIRKTNR